MIYTVTFNPAIDYVVQLEHLTQGTVNRTGDEAVYCGGKGINVSTVLTNLGIENVALGFLAGFTGDAVENALQRKGLRTDFIRLQNGMTRINVKIRGACETEINGKGPDIGPAALALLYKKLDAVTDGDDLVLAGSIPAGMPGDIYEKIMAALQEKKVRVTVDATGDLLLNVLKYRPFLIKPNQHELGELFGRTLKTGDDIRACAAKLQDKGARNVLVSLAGDGAILLDETGQFQEIGVPRGTVRNAVGAGDSMVAVFLAGYLKLGTYSYALRMGAAAGSATAFSDELATKEEILKLLNTF